MEPTSIIEEAPGVKSSKRIIGIILAIAGGTLRLAVGIAAMFIQIVDSASALSASDGLLISGCALLGVTVLEGIGKK